MMKISTVIYPICLVSLFTISNSTNAENLSVNNSNNSPSVVLNQQSTASGQDGGAENTGAGSEDKAELEKKCAMARKNIDILESSKGTKTFRTSKDEIVMYTPDQIKQMIKDNKSVLEDECS